MKRKSVKVATISGAYLRKVASSMCSSLLKAGRTSAKRRQMIDGYLVTASRRGETAHGRVIDFPGFLAILGRATGSLMPPWQAGFCKMLAQNRDVFIFPGAVPELNFFSGHTAIAPPIWSGTPPDPATTLSMTWSGRPAQGAGACICTTAIQADSTKSYPFAYGTGRVWLMVGYANPTRTRDDYSIENNEAELLGEVRDAPSIGVCLELSSVLAPYGAVAHPPRPARGWGDIMAGGEAAIAWAFATPYPSETRHPNFWAACQVTKQQDDADYRGRRCLLILRMTDMKDNGEYAMSHWLVDPADAYPGRSSYGYRYNKYNYHLPSSPVVLSDGSLVLFDPYKSDLEEGGVTTCRYTLGLIRVGVAGVTSTVLHTSDIPLLNGGDIESVDDAKLAQYHFEGADVAEDDVVVGMCFGYEFAAEPTVTIHRVEAGVATSTTVATVGFVRCVYRVMPCHSGFSSLSPGHWGLHLGDPRQAITYLALGSTAGADKVTYIGNRKWAVYVSTDPQHILTAGMRLSSGTLAVAVYDDATGEVNLAGVIRTDAGSSAGATTRIGRMDCVVKERADENGVVVRKATLIATWGGGIWYPGNSGISQGKTYISHDSGATWRELIDYGGSPAGVVYCGNILEPRTEPISKGL